MTATARSKYGNKPVLADGYMFDSQAEYRRYCELRLLEQAGVVSDIGVHPQWRLEVNGLAVASYAADFRYYDVERNGWVVEDVKGMRTDVYKLKKLLMKACHGIDIVEVKA